MFWGCVTSEESDDGSGRQCASGWPPYLQRVEATTGQATRPAVHSQLAILVAEQQPPRARRRCDAVFPTCLRYREIARRLHVSSLHSPA